MEMFMLTYPNLNTDFENRFTKRKTGFHNSKR